MDFLKKHAMRGADLSQLHRRDVWSIPLSILREAVVNAVVHADYSQKGAPIRISFFDDRIEIENPGILLPGLTFDDIRQGVSKLRNRANRTSTEIAALLAAPTIGRTRDHAILAIEPSPNIAVRLFETCD